MKSPRVKLTTMDILAKARKMHQEEEGLSPKSNKKLKLPKKPKMQQNSIQL